MPLPSRRRRANADNDDDSSDGDDAKPQQPQQQKQPSAAAKKQNKTKDSEDNNTQESFLTSGAPGSSSLDDDEDEEGEEWEEAEEGSGDDDDDDSDDSSYRSSSSESSNAFDFDDDSSAPGKKRKRRKTITNVESRITSKVRNVLADPEKCAEVRKQLESVLAQADMYSDFLRQQVADAGLDDNENENSNTENKNNNGSNNSDRIFQPPPGCALLPHQVYGVRWLTSIFQNGINAILADEMGLGKTIQVIGFIARLCQERLVGPHIIVVPLATIPNWRREFERWGPQIRVLSLHGKRDDYPGLFRQLAHDFRPPYSNEEKMRFATPSELLQRCGGVVLTSYEVAMRNSDTLTAISVKWRTACKEAYQEDVAAWQVKSRQEQAEFQKNQQQQQQLAQTGEQQQQPAQKQEQQDDAIDDNFFAGVTLGGGGDDASENAASAAATASDAAAAPITTLKQLIEKQKASKPVIDSDKNLLKSWGVLVVDEAHRLKNFQCLLIQQLRGLAVESRLLLTGTPMHNRLTELWSILHFIVPELFQSVVNFRVWFGVSDELVRTTCSFQDQVAAKENHLTTTADNAGGASSVADPKKLEDVETAKQLVLLERTDDTDFAALFNKAIAAAKPAAPAPKRGGGGRGLPAASAAATDSAAAAATTETAETGATMRLFDDEREEDQRAAPATAAEAAAAKSSNNNNNPNLKMMTSPDESVDIVAKMHRVLRPFMLRRTKAELPDLNIPRKIEVLVRCPLTELQRTAYTTISTAPRYRASRLPYLRMACNHPYCVGKTTAEFERFAKEIREVNGDTLTFNGNPEMRKRYLEHLLGDSSKTAVAMNLLPNLAQQGHIMIVFSQFVQVLDVLAELLDAYGRGELHLGQGGCFHCTNVPLVYRRLQGGQSVDERTENLNDFLDPGKGVKVFLVSTRSGGVGLNLMRADTVLMMDPDFNPHNDLQAIDRCHRIGQTRPVAVLRFYSHKTVEEVILECCTHKLRLEALVIGAGQYKGITGESSSAAAVVAAKQQQTPAATLLLGGGGGDDEGDDKASDEATIIAERRKAEANAIRNTLARLRNMVLADFAAEKGGAVQASSPTNSTAAASPTQPTEQQQQQQQRDNTVFADDQELLAFVPSAVGGGHWVFNVDAEDPTWGLDMLACMNRSN